jgi:hypothetical protein
MQCKKEIMIPGMIGRKRQCKCNALSDKNYCYKHDPSTADEREQKKIDRFMKKRNLNKAYLIAKQNKK